LELARIRPIIGFGLALTFTLVILLTACGEAQPKTLEQQAVEIDKSLMCPVCPAETIDQSQVPLAADMRAFVREKLSEGWTKQQILDYFSSEDRYGPSVLAAPPRSGAHLLVWVFPPIGVISAVLILFFILRSMRSGGTAPSTQPIQPGDPSLNPYLAQVDAALEASDTQPDNPSRPSPAGASLKPNESSPSDHG
jgi:cytochrome c-type biogenesis protein CcmH